MKEEKFPHTRKPLHWRRQGVAWGKLQRHGGECSNREECRGHSGEIPAQRVGANQHSPAREACLLNCRPGEMGAGSKGSAFGGHIPGRGLGLAA